ncbi:hypothetical protein [Herbiconiux liangxiaofengii]|uniref:hypothetical protein n=1 Tax=Herbiconiux liangxiaofengii TaxID=3342795 RepID=UPI0035B8E9CB
MRGRTQAAIAVWRSRGTRAVGERAFLVYLGAMVALVAIIPVGRAVWLSASGADGVAVFSSPVAPPVVILVVAGLWAGALLLGRERGPAIRRPFLTHALATSPAPVSQAFRGPLLRSGALVVSVCAGAAVLVGASLSSAGLAGLFETVAFAVVGLLVGVIATVAWLAGQAMPRVAALLALVIAVLGTVTVAFPALRAVTPWGWVGLAYPLDAVASAPALTVLTALTIPLVAAVPSLMNRIAVDELVAQASRWSSATSQASGMDFDAAARLYQRKPHVGRRLPAVRSGRRLASTFVLRDAVGTLRTPGRLVAAVLGLALAVALLALAAAPAAPGWLLGAAAGIIAFASLGPLTDGIRHAASVAGDLPLYGISDERLLAQHTLFPLAVALVVAAAVVVVSAAMSGTVPGAEATGAVLLVLLALATRIGNALKGPLPPVLLTPIPTAMGDPMAAVRLAWALDAAILAALAGTACALVVDAPVLALGVAGAIATTGISRWRHRR